MRYERFVALFPVLTLILAATATATADEIDVSGHWQMNMDCGEGSQGVTSTSFWAISEEPTTGALTVNLAADCGTVLVAGALHKHIGCTTDPTPIGGQIAAAELDIPVTDFFLSDTPFETPFWWAVFRCTTARIESEERIDGTVTSDGLGMATSISGIVDFGSLHIFDAADATCWFVPDNTDVCDFLMLRNDVVAGSNITVEPLQGGTITFSHVSTSGVAAITPLTEPDGAVPPEFQLLHVPLYYDVTTTATISGDITTCLPYPDEDNDGVVDDTTPSIDENELQILHEEGGVFVNRTVSRDPVNNRICAQTTSLSQHVLGAASESAAVPTSSPPAWLVLSALLAFTMGWALRRRGAAR
jgi:hypothetical protein